MSNSIEFQTLETNRLVLRALTPEIYKVVLQDSPEDVCRFFGFESLTEYEREKNRFEKGVITFNKSFLYFHILEKESMKTIGWCGYHTWYLDHDRAELGYGLYSDLHKKKGYMSEAISPILTYGFNEMNLHRIEAFASPQNTPSVKVLLNNGFQHEGLLKEHYLKDGIYEDSAVYAVFNPKNSK